jgi:hypothetical protein
MNRDVEKEAAFVGEGPGAKAATGDKANPTVKDEEVGYEPSTDDIHERKGSATKDKTIFRPRLRKRLKPYVT